VAASTDSIRPVAVNPLPLEVVATRLGLAAVSASEVAVTGVAASSDDVREGDLFFALPGAKSHGANFVPEAIARGAFAVVTDADGLQLMGAVDVPVLEVADPRSVLGLVSSWVYETELHTPRLFGVTGTNGKTTVVYLVSAILRQLGHVTGLSSTSERIIAGRVEPAGLTTPEANQMHAMIAAMNERGVTDAVLEVSAHAVTRHRVDALRFDAVGFTNFSQDHLDDYGSMESYFAAKRELFTPAFADRGVVVVDSPWCQQLVRDAQIPVTTVGLDNATSADWRVRVIDAGVESTEFALSHGGEELATSVPLVGAYSAVNAALAIAMCVEGGCDLTQIREVLDRDGGIRAEIPGRTELISGEGAPRFFVDYGHTPEAFAVTLAGLRAVTTGKLIMVFGADGDRDTTKREAMGANAARGADVVIITDYHPRSEDPALIRASLLAGARHAGASSDIREEADPSAAVRLALALAVPGDTILYAGPGDEDYREIAGKRIPYSARDDVREALTEAGWATR